MNTITKQQFFQRPSIQRLSQQEREARWKQHLSDVSNNTVSKKKEIRNNVKVGTSRSTRTNPYLAALMDPEEAGRGIGIPDEFAAPTFKLQQIINIPVTIDPTSRNFSCVVRPDCRNTVGMTNAFTSESKFNLTDVVYDISTKILNSSVPEMTVDLDTEKVSSVADNVRLIGANPVPIRNFAASSSSGPHAYPFLYLNPGLGYLQAYPNSATRVSSTLYYANQSSPAEPVNTGTIYINCEFYDANLTLLGTGSLLNTDSSVSDTYVQWTYDIQNYWEAAGFPAGAVWWAFRSLSKDPESTVGTLVVERFTSSIDTPNWPANYPTFGNPVVGPIITDWYDCPDFDTISGFDNIRVVSMSAWANYRGSVLQNDNISSMLVYTNQNPNDCEASVTSYNYISKSTYGYNGPLNSGTYVLWRPTQILQAVKWRKPFQNDPWSDPFITISGHMPLEGVLNLRVVINFEVQTNRTLYQLTVSPYSQEDLHHAMVALSHFKPAMENASHAERIRAFLLGVAKGAYNARVPLAASILAATGNASAIPIASSVLSALPNIR